MTAVLVYQIQSYRRWQRYFGRDDLSHGSFGENLTVAGLADDQVAIGDRYRIGEGRIRGHRYSYAALSPIPTSSWTCED
jgi:MOSC domain-containing protein YiiM